jgi:heme A synthase
MSPGLRRALYAAFGLLWLSGSAWLVLHYLFRTEGEFGPAPHPWEPGVLTVHGIVAMLALFLFGWVSGGHIGDNWRPRLRRASGVWLTSLLGALVLTGIANYYLVDGGWHEGSALVHEIIGVAVLLPLAWHFFKPRRRQSSTPGRATL